MKTAKIALVCLTGLLLSGNVIAANSNGNKDGNKPVVIANQKTGDNGIVNEPIVGAPYHVIWTFQANQKGNYKIKFSYVRPWEKKVSPIKTVEYVVEVSGDNKDKSVANLKSGIINKVGKGQKFNVSLEENGSTGYSWIYSTDDKAIKLFRKISGK